MLDGPDGAGKSTQARWLAWELQRRGIRTRLLREPGGTQAGEAIRALLLERRALRLTAAAETFLFEAARAQLVAEVIRPALARGTWVICDRFTLSTLAYQGCAGGVNLQAIKRMSELATGGLRPALYLVLWVDVQTGLQRRKDRAADRMEAKGRAYLQAVSDAYRKLASKAKGQLKLMDARGSEEEVRAQIWKSVAAFLP